MSFKNHNNATVLLVKLKWLPNWAPQFESHLLAFFLFFSTLFFHCKLSLRICVYMFLNYTECILCDLRFKLGQNNTEMSSDTLLSVYTTANSTFYLTDQSYFNCSTSICNTKTRQPIAMLYNKRVVLVFWGYRQKLKRQNLNFAHHTMVSKLTGMPTIQHNASYKKFTTTQ